MTIEELLEQAAKCDQEGRDSYIDSIRENRPDAHHNAMAYFIQATLWKIGAAICERLEDI